MATLEKLHQELEFLNDAIRFFRVGMETLGSKRLAYFQESLAARLTKLPGDVVVSVCPVLEEIVYAQADHDYIWVADLLEFELLPTLFPGMAGSLTVDAT